MVPGAVAGREDQGGADLRAVPGPGVPRGGEVLMAERSLLEPIPDVYRHVSCPFPKVPATSAQGAVGGINDRLHAPCTGRRKRIENATRGMLM